jgi:hypothetical protein
LFGEAFEHVFYIFSACLPVGGLDDMQEILGALGFRSAVLVGHASIHFNATDQRHDDSERSREFHQSSQSEVHAFMRPVAD